MSVFQTQLIVIIMTSIFYQKVLSQLEVNKVFDLRNSGQFGCLLMITQDVENCKTRFSERLASVAREGYSMDSEEYRKSMCCGFWSVQSCVAKSANDRCNEKAAKMIVNMNIYSSEEEKLFYKRCDGYEKGSKVCGSASQLYISFWTLITGLVLTLIKQNTNH